MRIVVLSARHNGNAFQRAIKNKVRGGMGDRTHWLYYADDKYEVGTKSMILLAPLTEDQASGANGITANSKV